MNTGAEDKRDTTWAMLCHLTALCAYVFPLGNIIAPLIIWLVKRDEFPFVDEQGRESLNFQISMTIYALIAGLLYVILIGFVLLPIVIITDIVLIIIASVKTSRGEHFRYPFTIRFLT